MPKIIINYLLRTKIMKVQRILHTFLLLSAIVLISACGKKKEEHNREREDLILNKEVMTKEKLEKITPDMVLDVLNKGNERYYQGISTDRDYVQQAGKLKAHQYPFACIFTTSDSRMSPEIIFDQGLGDLYNIRLDGLNVTPEVLGSMEHAVQGIGVKVILVLGQTSSDAIKNACDEIKLGNIATMIKEIEPIIDQVTTEPTESRNSSNADFVAKVSKLYMIANLNKVGNSSQILKDAIAAGKIKLVGGMYNTEDGKVSFFDSAGNEFVPKDAQRTFSPEEQHGEEGGEHKTDEHGKDSTKTGETEHKTEEGHGGH